MTSSGRGSLVGCAGIVPVPHATSPRAKTARKSARVWLDMVGSFQKQVVYHGAAGARRAKAGEPPENQTFPRLRFTETTRTSPRKEQEKKHQTVPEIVAV